ncbi:hypothetical protein [Nodularia chucula]|uniref:hypothetical protein n=1 Tax=Nodularia chucula TaxID=3093667 RepID=UPI0039C69F19
MPKSYSVKKLEQDLTVRSKKIPGESWLQQLFLSLPFLLAGAVFLSVISFTSPMLLFCLLASGLISMILQQIGQQLHLSKRWVITLQILAISVILSIFWLDYFALAAHAQFFGRAENFFRNTLTQDAGGDANGQTAVSLIFNVLRAIYLLYIAVSLIGVINAVRKDEDWQSIARIPLLVVVAVTVADVLTGFVIGDTSN